MKSSENIDRVYTEEPPFITDDQLNLLKAFIGKELIDFTISSLSARFHNGCKSVSDIYLEADFDECEWNLKINGSNAAGKVDESERSVTKKKIIRLSGTFGVYPFPYEDFEELIFFPFVQEYTKKRHVYSFSHIVNLLENLKSHVVEDIILYKDSEKMFENNEPIYQME